jgi:hypothetical protein
LIFAVKESGLTAPNGVIICALLISSVYKTDSIPKYRHFLIYLICAYKNIVVLNSRIDSDYKLRSLKQIKDRIYKKMCDFLFPETKCAKYEEILHLTENFNNKNYWFNEPSVILLMQYINRKHMTELDFIFESLNNYKATDNKKTKDLVSEYYLHMFILFHVERSLLDKTSQVMFST